MGIKRKLGELVFGGAGVASIGGGAYEESKALEFYGKYNGLYNVDLSRIDYEWQNNMLQLKERFPSESMLNKGFTQAFYNTYGGWLRTANAYQTDANILFGLGAVGVAVSLGLFYLSRKQAKQAKKDDVESVA